MLKRIAAFMVLLTMVFAFQGNVWAAAAHAEDTMAQQQTEVIALAENPQLAALNQDVQLLGATGFGGIKIEPWFWVLSIIPGLGQFMMGDVVRGILFFLGGAIVSVVWTILSLTIGTAIPQVWGVLSLLLPLVLLGVWIWNLVDAYFMNKAKTGMSSIDPMEKAAEMRDQLTRVAEFMQKNQVVATEGGLGVNSQLATF